jgi:diguanylate cyclase (GGDEF)-like protein/PAS domain S-box-containing protein
MDSGGKRESDGSEGAARSLFGLPSAHDADRPRDSMDVAHRATEELRAVAELMEDAQRVANFGSWEWRIAGDEVYWSDQLYRIFGLPSETSARPFRVTFATYLDRVHPDEREAVRERIDAALGDVSPFRFSHRIVRPDGEVRSVRCQGEPVLDPATREIVRVVGVCQDITEMAQIEREKTEADARFRSAFENAPIGIALVDFSEGPDGRFTEVNRALVDLTGRSAGELIGSKLTALCLAEDTEIDQPQRERLLAGDIERYTVEKRALMSDDRLVWLELNVSTIPTQGKRTAGIVQIQDVTERKRFEEQLRYIADHDSLTGLLNRRRFREELESQIALRRRYGGSGALLLIDLDRLKAVNDTRGHGAGDVALRKVAEAMRGRFRSTDVLARLAGDEFAVLLPSAEAHEAQVLGNALIERLASDEVATWGVSVSVGVATFGAGDTRTTEDVMAAADAALYRAKQRGGAVTEVADAQPPASAASRTADRASGVVPRRSLAGDPYPKPRLVREPTLADRIQAALAGDDLLVYGQPVVDLRTGRIAHHELLVRMRDESGGVLAASDFLGAAAQTPGLCSAIDEWVVGRAVGMLGNGSRGARFQVNLSGETLRDEGRLETLLGRIAGSGVDEEALAFEIGESSIRMDVERASATLENLAEAGCPLVLDGFSAGFGSFEYLQRLPVKQIKIDGVVVRSLLAEPDYGTMRAIVRLAQGTRKSTVAKLVESPSILPMLRMHGVDMAQGFEVGEPVPLAA